MIKSVVVLNIAKYWAAKPQMAQDVAPPMRRRHFVNGLMKLPEEGDDFEHRQRTNAELAKVMLAHGLELKVQVLDAEEYFAWLGARPHTYQTMQEYPGGRHVSGDEAKALLGID